MVFEFHAANSPRLPGSPSNSFKIIGSHGVTFSPTVRLHKSFSCNTNGSPRKCCKQKTYGKTNSFSCNRVEKSLHLCLAGLRIRWFDPIAEASELPKHLRSAELLRSFGDRWAPFFVTNSLVQDQPDQPTLSMGDGPNGLIVSQARDRAAIHDLEDASFGSGCGVSSLIE